MKGAFPFALSVFGIGLLACIALLAVDEVEEPKEQAAIVYKPSSLPEPDPTPEELAQAQAVQNPNNLRAITGNGITPPPPVTGPLKRIAAAEKPVEEVEIPEEMTIFRPVIEDGATFLFKNNRYRLRYVKPLAVDETCESWLGGTWPCGMRARTALRAFLLQVAMTCRDFEQAESGPIAATCNRGPIDVAHWIVQNGWAHVTDDAPLDLKMKAKAAEQERKGIWQTERKTLDLVEAELQPELGDDINSPREGTILIETSPPILWVPSETEPADMPLSE
ncbi:MULTISPECIES: thermonuclease family protein [Pseudovibrio]|uniref:thermonuclease family protein n=1 Tax=Stappiaceae TaxID=2821832 RepID=UPI0023668A59|nr:MULTISPECIES: hypothetical protein [Pseudovibrio]MDD7911138.1 hypothetical protein [Pseudovibrio exalbescens]MDX5593174.1 hypothetical protein [Pseudovibrio sp. SPO723]